MTTPDDQQPPEVVEEYFLNERTDVEEETETEGSVELSEIDEPWRPDDIRVSTKQFSLRNVLDMIEDKSLDLAPDFQRLQVWKPAQKSRLIESILLQIPLPAFYFAEDPDGAMHVVDGLQRLSTVRDFVRGDGGNQFGLKGLEYLHRRVGGMQFDELPVVLQRRINNAQITVHVIDPTTPPDVMYDIFKRINTGGAPLNSQEIRHCMSKQRSRDILKGLTQSDEFNRATNNLGNHIRMHDREVALRFAAFWMFGVEGYETHKSMDSFLQHTTSTLDSSEEFPDQKVDALREAFLNAMHNAALVFEDRAFRKWPNGVDRRTPVNRALFESWSIALAYFSPDDVLRRRDCIVATARDLMTNDIEYINSITLSTGDKYRVRTRFQRARLAASAGVTR